MRHLLAVASALCVLSIACGDDTGTAPPIDAAVVVPPGCVANDFRDDKTVTVSGMVVDFTTDAPVAGATVDLTTGWDVASNFPPPECPLLGTVTTDAAGHFGPIAIQAGSTINPSIVLFIVRGAGRATTVSDSRACATATCNLFHTIAAPASTLAAAWRTDLAAGGMSAADTRGLVAFKYKNLDGTPAAGVVPFRGTLTTSTLTPGTEVRFLAPDRTALTPAADATTTAAGVALVGAEPAAKVLYIGGQRTADAWPGVGCLVEPGAIFLEDKTVSPP